MKCSDDMIFRTVVPISKADFELVPDKKIILMGSCFTDNVGMRFENVMWNVAANPCGVLYNPASIVALLQRALRKIPVSESELVNHDDKYLSWLFDSHFSSVSTGNALKKMNDALDLTSDYLQTSQALIVTFGTAGIYELVDTFEIVANCHKFPSSKFVRRKMSVEEIVSQWKYLIAELRSINPNIKLIFTVSPIRHFKDGAFENTLSKSTLLMAVESLINSVDNAYYFPAYEIMLDDLRDYRFYESDMLHPSQVAIDYIWQKFCAKFMSQSTKQLMSEALKLYRRIHHRPITDDTLKIEAFKSETMRLLTDFKANHPYLNIPAIK